MRNLFAAAVRVGAGSALAALLAAAAPASATDRLTSLDQTLQDLKEEAVRLQLELHEHADAARFPDGSRTSFYVAVEIAGFLLDEMTLRVDDGEPAHYEYNYTESWALQKGSWHRLRRVGLPPGAHRVTAEFRGHFYDARGNDEPLTGKLEAVFDKDADALDLILPISRNSRLDKPGLPEVARLDSRRTVPSRNVWLPALQRRSGALGEDELGGPVDPRFRYAQFLAEDKRYFSALAELRDIRREAGERKLPLAYLRLLADCYLGFGMSAQAERGWQAVAAEDSSAASIIEPQLELATFEYQRGYFEDATQRLRRLQDILPPEQRGGWRELLVGTLLAQRRYNEAVAVFSEVEEVDDLSPYQRYNYAVALVRDGQGREGRRVLNSVGTINVEDRYDLVLRDKANLTLGYQFLETKQAENAAAVFGRIRTQGPYSDHALLGLGWAELAPRRQGRDSDVEDEDATDDALGTELEPGENALGLQARGGIGISVADQRSLLRALVPWLELIKRDPMNAAVQEGMLAIPWALDRLEAYEQSLKYYQDATGVLELTRGRLDQAIEAVGNGRMVNNMIRRDPDSEAGWRWRLRDLVDTPENYFLQTLVADLAFQESLKNYRDARLLARWLRSWIGRVDTLADGGSALGRLSLQQRIDRLRGRWVPPTGGLRLGLQHSTWLAAPGAWSLPLPTRDVPPVDLQVLPVPVAMAGEADTRSPLKQDLQALAQRFDEAVRSHFKHLTSLARRELVGQKQQNERYLTEARFAVARIYDRQSRKAP